MHRMEVRCCCRPDKILGSLPVPEKVRIGAVRSITFPVAGSFDWETGNRILQSSIKFEAAAWKMADGRYGGLALKHENVTIETLRRIPGFLEAT